MVKKELSSSLVVVKERLPIQMPYWERSLVFVGPDAGAGWGEVDSALGGVLC